MSIKINHAKVATAEDLPEHVAQGRVVKSDWNADLVIDPSSFASDAQMLAGADDYLIMKPKQIKDFAGTGNKTQSLTRANIIAALDFTAGNIVNVTDNLPTGITLLAEPTMTAGVKVGDRFELFFNKLQATQCTVQFPSTPTNLSYPFNNGTQAHIAFEWSGTRLVEV